MTIDPAELTAIGGFFTAVTAACWRGLILILDVVKANTASQTQVASALDRFAHTMQTMERTVHDEVVTGKHNQADVLTVQKAS